MPKRSPLFIYVFILSVSSLLAGLSALMPNHEVELPFGLRFKFPTLDELINVQKPEYVDITDVVAMGDSLSAVSDRDETMQLPSSESEALLTPRHKKINIDSLRAEEVNIQRIEFSAGDKSNLERFFRALDECLKTGNPTHIFHYGDSQIEGDRMTSYIRDRLQKRFGGSGVGMVSLSNQSVVPLIHQDCSENWSRYPVFGNQSAKSENAFFGAMASFSSYTPFPTDSSLADKEVATATVNFDLGSALYNNAKKFSRATLYYGPVFDAVKVTRPSADSSATAYLKGSERINTLLFDCAEGTTELSLTFESKISPQFYGLLFDDGAGVSMSNIPMRGGSGTVFHKIDRELLRKMYSLTNTSLIIMQYGGNVLPYIKDEQACVDYGRWFYNQIVLLKGLCPKAAILVVGPADMSLKVDQYYETYTYLENVRDALRSAAFKAGVGFWDTYTAMGGKNSMPAWVESDPPLAGTDYTHFTPRGARVISELLYKALIIEYDHYINHKNQSNQIP